MLEPVLSRESLIGDLGNPRRPEHRLHCDFIHPQCRAQDTGPHIGHVGQFKQSLNRSILTEGPVENRNDHIDQLG